MDKQSIVFFPGLDGTGISFEPIKALFPSNFDITIIRYPNEKLSFDETVDCAADQLLSARATVVVAESFSGPVAIELLGSGRFTAGCLVLAATFAKSPRPALLPIGRWLPLEFLLRLPLPEALLRYILGGEEFMHVLKPMWERVKNAVPPAVLAHRLRVVSMVDVRKWLPKLSIPCCYIQAADDVVVPSTALLDFLEAMPDLVVKTIKGPHFILQAQPAASVAVIEEFRSLIADAREHKPSCDLKTFAEYNLKA